jgi:hypothetical protein
MKAFLPLALTLADAALNADRHFCLFASVSPDAFCIALLDM